MTKRIATEDLFLGSIRVHRQGDEIDVTKEQEELYKWGDFLVSPGSKAASQAVHAAEADKPEVGSAVPVTPTK